MSLVERAAKRLEELGKAGSHGVGRPGIRFLAGRSRAEPGRTGGSKARSLQKRGASARSDLPVGGMQPGRLTRSGSTEVDRDVLARREPTLGDAITEQSSTPGERADAHAGLTTEGASG